MWLTCALRRAHAWGIGVGGGRPKADSSSSASGTRMHVAAQDAFYSYGPKNHGRREKITRRNTASEEAEVPFRTFLFVFYFLFFSFYFFSFLCFFLCFSDD